MATNLFTAFEEAKRRSIARALNNTSSSLPIPWCYELARRMQDIVGEDLMPYGVEANRTTLDAFLQYGFEQGVLPPSAASRRSCSRRRCRRAFGFRRGLHRLAVVMPGPVPGEPL